MVEEAAGRLGRLDILINNAGTNIRKAPETYSLDEWREVLETNLTSVFVTSQAAYPHLKRSGGGKIVNIGSMLSIFGAPFAAPYGASKGGVVQLTKGLATAWAKDNIQVNAVLPGWIDTPLTVQAELDVDGLHDRVLARTPAGRWGCPRISPASPCSSRRAPRTSSPAWRFRWTAGTRRRADSRGPLVRGSVVRNSEPINPEPANREPANGHIYFRRPLARPVGLDQIVHHRRDVVVRELARRMASSSS